MDLIQNTRTSATWYYGDGTFQASAGQSVIIETSPDGEEVLSAVVPDGKTWTVHITLHIEEE